MMKLFSRYINNIIVLADKNIYEKQDLLISRFLLDKDEGLEIYYAPFDYINCNAKIIIIGITPGFEQMRIVFRTAREGLLNGIPYQQVLKDAKQMASFAGSMRKNLVFMLDDLLFPQYLGIKSSHELFSTNVALLHPTSAIRYPTFVNTENYTGHNPTIINSPLLKKYINIYLRMELENIPDSLIIPLGNSVKDALHWLVDENVVDIKRCLFGFPHPSGSNGHRIKQYQENKEKLKEQVHKWFLH